MAKKKKKTLLSTSFLVKTDPDTFTLIEQKELESYPPAKIYALAILNFQELKDLLLFDSVTGDHFINDLKVTDELEKTLNKFNILYPNILQLLKKNNYLKNKFATC